MRFTSEQVIQERNVTWECLGANENSNSKEANGLRSGDM